MNEGDTAVRHADVCCPFCGLLCDDLVIDGAAGGVTVVEGGCPRAERGFAAASMDAATMAAASPRVDGEPCDLDTAVAAAARLLGSARRPVFGGLASDVAGIRAAVSLADRCGAVIDHAHGPVMRRNLRVLQESGWFATTLAEVRARADLVLVAGAGVFERFPRLASRVLAEPPTAREGVARRCVLLGPWPDGASVDGCASEVIACPTEAIGEVAGGLRALVRGTTLEAASIGGVPVERLRALAASLREASYAVVTWAAADLDFAHADLAVEHLVALARDLNTTTRAAALPLGGTEGDLTASQVVTWQTGFPLQVDLAGDRPVHDPLSNGAARLLAAGECDALLWLACHSPDLLPPAGDTPTVLLGHPRMAPAREPAVYLPAGVPGVDHGGHLFRTDGVVSLPVRRLRESTLLPAAHLLARIERAVAEASS